MIGGGRIAAVPFKGDTVSTHFADQCVREIKEWCAGCGIVPSYVEFKARPAVWGGLIKIPFNYAIVVWFSASKETALFKLAWAGRVFSET